MIADRWGVTDAEVAAHYPCDDLVERPTLEAWRGVTIAAPAEHVWAWVKQIRLAPYSYDWIDNLGRPSPRDLRDLPDPTPGEPFTASCGRPLGMVLAVEHADHLTARIMGAVLTYRLTDVDPDRTRLVLKVVGTFPRPLADAVSLGDLVMARRQLLNLKRRAERSHPPA
ncbi:polyketide cyclase [Nocardioides silvaticus]|uniref:Polyketide cyclase n=1 Tax=Nocardioides silvaticus TaxID=2201891 RepID=A0A316THZ8_9ACTN|nr:polyketide cyclase [Nocardioides silvaticus]PWN03141.1 polyketide cyclase [Nocardioides silvaticus]